MNQSDALSAEDFARAVLQRKPAAGLFAGMDWRLALAPFPLEQQLVDQLDRMGRILLQFHRAANLLYRLSWQGRQPGWISHWLDLGKPKELIAWQRDAAFKHDIPRVFRPDVLLTEDGLRITELDSVPGGIGLTAWLNQTYCTVMPGPAAAQALTGASSIRQHPLPAETVHSKILGGSTGMLTGFASIFGPAQKVHVVISEEASTYRPEMEWIAHELGGDRFHVCGTDQVEFAPGDAVYRFFELFDLPQVAAGKKLYEAAKSGQITLTPPLKPAFEEKMWLALLWNRNLYGYWRQELGESFFNQLLSWVPYTWVMDPAELPPHAAIPELNLTDWRQLGQLSQRQRALILKISGFSELAWGSRGVHLGSDLSQGDWMAVVDRALRSFPQSPYVLQRYHKPGQVTVNWFDVDNHRVQTLAGRARLCPYYFVSGEQDAARAQLGGVLATLCPRDKKIIHGMKDAVLAPCMI